MLRPSKHSHPDQTVLHVALLMIATLRKRRVMGFDELRFLAGAAAPGAGALFIPTVDFLFLLGLIDYLPKTDSFEYVGTT